MFLDEPVPFISGALSATEDKYYKYWNIFYMIRNIYELFFMASAYVGNFANSFKDGFTKVMFTMTSGI